MLAELKGKISSKGSNLSDRLEDKLTGDFFGALRYIPFNKAMKPILKRTRIMGNDTLDVINILSDIDIKYWADNISFWPYNSLGEFDVILEFKEIIIGIEVKLYSGLSSDDDIDQSLEDIEVQSINQLSRESRILKEKIQYSNKPALLIFIAPENKCRSICNNVYERNIIEDRIQLGYLSWEEILEEMKKINLDSKLDNYEGLIINDIILLLKRKGLERFKSFEFECKDIDCKLWFKFDDEIYKGMEFNYNKTIQGKVTMNLGDNIRNAFEVVLKTYKNVDKLIKYCDLISIDCGYEPVTNKFLRYKSDSNYEGWLINSFTKLYQYKEDTILENEWKDGPVFAMEINFEDIPTVYLSKFEYEDISNWGEGISPRSYEQFTCATDCEDNGFIENIIKDMDGYFISKPTPDIKDKYWGIERIIYTKVDLLEIDSSNIAEKIFGEFDILKDI